MLVEWTRIVYRTVSGRSQNFRSIRLEVKKDGSVKMNAQDMGRLVEKNMGRFGL